MTDTEISRRLEAIEARLAELEKHSHPPVDLNAPVMRAMARILRQAAESVEDG